MTFKVRTPYRNFIPIVAGALLSLAALFLFRHAYYAAYVYQVEDFLPGDEKMGAYVDAVTLSDDGKYLIIAGWAYDGTLYTGYNYGTGRSIVTVANNTSFALTDGTFVYLLPTVGRGRDDMSLAHPDVEVPEGAARRYGILSFMKLGSEGLTYQKDMNIAVVSEREDGMRVLFDTGEKVPAL